MFEALTNREREVTIGLSKGRGMREVAYDLRISPHTAEAHRHNAYRKLKIHSVAELTRIVVAWENRNQ